MSGDTDRWEEAEQHRRAEQERMEATRRAEERHRHEMEGRRLDERDGPDRPWR